LVKSLEGEFEHLAGSIDEGAKTWGELKIDINAVVKNPARPSGSFMSSLTKAAENMARANGLNMVTIDFKFVVNQRLANAAGWAREYGYQFTKTTAEWGEVDVTWSKTLE
jgi:hypothetical protein